MKVRCTVNKNGFHSPLNKAFFGRRGRSADDDHLQRFSSFFFVFLSFNRRVTVIDPQWQPTGSVSGVCGDANVVSHCFTACDVKLPRLWTATITARVWSSGLRCVSRVCLAVLRRVCLHVDAGSAALDLLNLEVASGTPYTHVQTRQCASLLNQPPMLIISVWSRFLKTQTDPPTRTGGKNQVTLSRFLFFFIFFF